MRNEIRSEFRKLYTTRTVWGLLFGVVALTSLGAWGTLVGHQEAAPSLAALPMFLLASVAVAILAVVLGVRSYTDEARHGSIVPTLLATPDRRRVVAAKLVATTATAAAFGLIALGVGSAFALVWYAAHGTAITAAAAPWAVLAGKMMLLGAVWSAIGVGVGLIVGHQVAAIVGSLVYLLVVENLVGDLASGVAKFLPGNTANAVLGITAGNPVLVAPLVGLGLLAGYVVLVVAAGTGRLTSRDIA